jgi:hypothetical protein
MSQASESTSGDTQAQFRAISNQLDFIPIV